jgi:hypothetical protein
MASNISSSHPRHGSLHKLCSRALLAVLALAVFSAIPAQAYSTEEYFTISGSGITSSGTLYLATTPDPNVDEITGVSGTFTDANAGGFSGAITGLVAGSYDSTSPSFDPYSYDNLFYPNSTTVTCHGYSSTGDLDFCGLLFTVTGGYLVSPYYVGSTGTLLDLGPGNKDIGTYAVDINFSDAAPEPSSWLFLASGLLLMGLLRFRKPDGARQL